MKKSVFITAIIWGLQSNSVGAQSTIDTTVLNLQYKLKAALKTIEPKSTVSTTNSINIKSFLKGNSSDITEALTQALQSAASLKKYVYIPAGTYKISTPIDVPHGVLGIEGDGKLATILIPADNLKYTFRISSSGNYSGFCIGQYQNSPQRRIKSNGILIEGEKSTNNTNDVVLLSSFSEIRVLGLYGFGIQIKNVYDSYFRSISVEECGTPEEYAFQVLSVNKETTNMSTFDQLQVEQSYRKAIFISPDVFCCVFSNIHAERVMDTIGDASFVLGGNRCLYESTRLTTLNSLSSIRVSGAFCTFLNFGMENKNELNLEGINGSTLYFINSYLPLIKITTKTNQIGKIKFLGGTIQKQATLDKSVSIDN